MRKRQKIAIVNQEPVVIFGHAPKLFFNLQMNALERNYAVADKVIKCTKQASCCWLHGDSDGYVPTSINFPLIKESHEALDDRES